MLCPPKRCGDKGWVQVARSVGQYRISRDWHGDPKGWAVSPTSTAPGFAKGVPSNTTIDFPGIASPYADNWMVTELITGYVCDDPFDSWAYVSWHSAVDIRTHWIFRYTTVEVTTEGHIYCPEDGGT